MYLTGLQLADFRTYPGLDLRPSPGLNILVGANGQGKTNLLEAVYLLATTRSMRAHRDHEMVRFGAPLARVVARVERESRPEVSLEMDIGPTLKVGKVNGVRHTRLIDLLGEMRAVQFSPTDVGLVTGSPSERRGFLNLQIAQAHGGYAYSLVYYKRVLEQRSRILKDAAHAGGVTPASRATLDALTEQMVLYGGQVLERRAHFVERLQVHADLIHRELAGPDQHLQVVYRPGWSGADPGAPSPESLRAALQRLDAIEVRRGMTLAGPHRDDLQLLIAGMDARIYASRGEQRTVALSLKLAEFALLKEITGEAPVMLLDDVLSELDDERSARVLRANMGPGQVFMTGASFRSFPPDLIDQARLYEIHRGEACEAPASGRAVDHAASDGSGAIVAASETSWIPETSDS